MNSRREFGVVTALAVAIWVASFPWMSAGPLSSATISALLLSTVVVVGWRSRWIDTSIASVRQHVPASVVIAAGGCAVVGLVLSTALGDEATYLDGRGPSVVRLLLLFSFSYGAITVILARLERGTWAGPALVSPAVVCAILAVIGVLYARAGVSPLEAYSDAAEQGTFRPILTAVRKIHQGLGGIDNSSTIRHIEIRGALCAVFVGLMLTRPSAKGPARWPLLGISLAVAFAVLQFSRANLLIVALASVGPAVLVLRRLHRRAVAISIAICVAVLFALLQVDALADAAGDGSNQSSEVRSSALNEAVGRLGDAMPLGVDTIAADGSAVVSPHNSLLDLTLGAGILGTIGALGWILVAAHGLVRSIRKQLAAPTFGAALAPIGEGGLFVIVTVRLMTGGGGLLDPVSWISFGAALASSAASRRQLMEN